MQIKQLLPCCVLSALVVGCGTTTNFNRVESQLFNEEHINEFVQNGSARVGNPLLRVKDYWVKKYTQPIFEAKNGFKVQFKYPFLDDDNDFMFGAVVTGQRFPVVGTKDVDGIMYNLIKPIPGKNTALAILVEDSGNIRTDIIINVVKSIDISKSFSVEFTPEKPIFEKYQVEQVNTTKGFINYELLYTGISGNTIRLLYREYTADSLAKPAFFQNLQYDLSKDKTIVFKEHEFLIKEANNNEIQFEMRD